MKKYIETKMIQATPAIRKGGKVYLPTDAIPRTMIPAEEGYKVVYEDGYESWSPKDVFEKAYQVADTPLDRMNIEHNELSNKCAGLFNFIGSETYNKLDHVTKGFLVAQYESMKSYAQLLCARATRMESGNGGIMSVDFGTAIQFLKAGLAIRRSGWNGNGLFVIKQIPAHIGGNVIPNMQSLPEYAKDLIMQTNGFVDYTSQCLIYNENTGRADSWAPSISDVFAEDWELVIA